MIDKILPELFRLELMEEIKDKKIILMKKINESFKNRHIEIRDIERNIIILEPWEIGKLLRFRRELRPLLESILD